MTSRGKMCFSSHSAAWGVIASAVKLRAISWIWRCSSLRSNWLIYRLWRRGGGPGRRVGEAASFLFLGLLLERPAVEIAPPAARRIAGMDGDPLEDPVAADPCE